MLFVYLGIMYFSSLPHHSIVPNKKSIVYQLRFQPDILIKFILIKQQNL